MNWDMDFEQPIFVNGKGMVLTFSQMVEEILNIIKEMPNVEYVLSVGTDSQVKPKANATKFISAVHLHRVGRGAWGWRLKQVEQRRYNQLKEKIMTECHLTQILAYKFFEVNIAEQVLEITIDHIYTGAEFSFITHVDIGENGKTKAFIADVRRMFEPMGGVVIKPDSYTASAYADKYSKW